MLLVLLWSAVGHFVPLIVMVCSGVLHGDDGFMLPAHAAISLTAEFLALWVFILWIAVAPQH
jgi:hypothetical protein